LVSGFVEIKPKGNHTLFTVPASLTEFQTGALPHVPTECFFKTGWFSSKL
jgi:hypothetical protein